MYWHQSFDLWCLHVCSLDKLSNIILLQYFRMIIELTIESIWSILGRRSFMFKLGSVWIYDLIHILLASSLKVSSASKLTVINMRSLFFRIALIRCISKMIYYMSQAVVFFFFKCINLYTSIFDCLFCRVEQEIWSKVAFTRYIFS